MNSIWQKIRNTLHHPSAGGLVLLAATIMALIVANTQLSGFYGYFLERVYFTIGWADDHALDFELKKPILLWINDGLMAVFFFLIGLEIKREIVEGALASKAKVFLPAFAAFGGMAVPALIFCYFNRDNPPMLHGWAIPAATDIAFALGILSLLGSRVPVSLKVLLAAIAIIDDLGAIIIIALFYSSDVYFQILYFAPIILLAMFLLNRNNVISSVPYVLLGSLLWLIVLKSGVHATLAGVMTALFIPTRSRENPLMQPAANLEYALHPWVAFAVLPLFAFANAGVSFQGITMDDVMDPVVLGIALGLVIGKQIGIFGCLWLAIKTGISPMPDNTSWRQLYGMSILCGIGFTMSLFIGGLAYGTADMQIYVRMGVLAGSVISAIAGYSYLRFSSIPKAKYQVKSQ